MNLTELDFYVEIIYTYKTTSAFNDIQTTSYTQNTSILNDLELKLGPRFKPQVFIILMSIVYLILFLCGLIGNLCSCLVITLNECMRTTINYYLFSLAISDVLSLLLGLLPELYSIIFGAYPWPFGRVFCILRTFAFETTTIASVLIILAFTFERWLRICKPFFAKTVSSSLKRALKIILSIWSTSFILALPFTYLTNTEYLIQDEPQSELCKPIDKYADYMYNLLLLSSIFLFILPMGLIITMYAMIGLTLWKSQSNNNPCSRVNSLKSTNSSYNHQLNKNQLNIKTDLSANKLSAAASSVSLSNFLQSKTRQTRRDVIKMLFVIVICFFLCWAPHHLQRIMSFYLYRINMTPYSKVPDVLQDIYEFLHYSSGIMIYISPSINPICYNFMSKRYRTTLKKTLKMLSKCSFKIEKNRQSQMTYVTYRNRKNYSCYSNIGDRIQ